MRRSIQHWSIFHNIRENGKTKNKNITSTSKPFWKPPSILIIFFSFELLVYFIRAYKNPTRRDSLEITHLYVFEKHSLLRGIDEASSTLPPTFYVGRHLPRSKKGVTTRWRNTLRRLQLYIGVVNLRQLQDHMSTDDVTLLIALSKGFPRIMKYPLTMRWFRLPSWKSRLGYVIFFLANSRFFGGRLGCDGCGWVMK